MDWITQAEQFINIVLIGLVTYFLKPWAGGYGTEKGKNLARKEDLVPLVAEMKVLHTTQKTIEAQIANQLWSHQLATTEKKNAYLTLINSTERLTTNLTQLSSLMAAERRGNDADQTHST